MLLNRSIFRHTSPRRIVCAAAACCLALTTAGCASGGFVDKSLEFVGVKAPENLDAAKEGAASLKEAANKLPTTRDVTLRIHAGQTLNTDSTGRALSVVTRIYKLRSTAQFSQATYAMFAANDSVRAAFADDVISVNELVLKPGQKYEVVENLPQNVTSVAVVALFRSPDALRWRFMFDTKAAAKTGITIGAHACALSVSEGDPVGAPPDALRLAGVQCR
jgi:type VI secretion system protein VasD